MEELLEKEQILMAYYVQYYREPSTEDVKKLEAKLTEGLGQQRYAELMKELIDEGLVIGMDEVMERERQGFVAPMPTHEGMLYINDVLNLQSDAAEELQLDYFRNYLESSGWELTLEPVKSFISEAIRAEINEKSDSNQP